MHSRCASFIFLHGKVSPLWVEAVAAVLVPFFNPAFSWALIVIRGKGWATLIKWGAAHSVLQSWTEHLGSKVHNFTVYLESSYCFQGKIALKPTCDHMRGISDFWRLFLLCYVPSSFLSFSHQDFVPLVDQQLLYTCCPYLGEYFTYFCYIHKTY